MVRPGVANSKHALCCQLCAVFCSGIEMRGFGQSLSGCCCTYALLPDVICKLGMGEGSISHTLPKVMFVGPGAAGSKETVSYTARSGD